jgi:alpha-beta hydrolase superfamily lysophospholipase
MEVKQEQWRFPASNGEGDIFARSWFSEKPTAIIQIAHGMSEHSARYNDFANFLSLHGFCVVANDHAGHGQSAQGHLGAFATKAGGFDFSVKDMHSLFLLAEEKIGKLPRLLFGHSMGSILTALYAERWGELSALALNGMPSAIQFSRLLTLIADCISSARGHHARSPLLERLTGSAVNLPPEEMERKRAWLTRDIEKIREFNNDPLCGFDYSAGGYSAMLHAYHCINSKKWGQNIPDIPILVVAGADDTASNMGKGPVKYAKQLTITGHKHVELKLFPECRHEIINELNRQEIYAFLCNWFKDSLPV